MYFNAARMLTKVYYRLYEAGFMEEAKEVAGTVGIIIESHTTLKYIKYVAT